MITLGSATRACFALATLVLATVARAQSSAAPDPRPARERVVGIGGVFFKAKDPAALAAWYERHLGITGVPRDYDTQPWTQEAGPTAFAPFSEKTKYFDRPEQQWMLNFRVRDLEAMARQLRADGIEVKVDPQTYPNGRFARIHDPEGNPIELWQPAGKNAPSPD